MKHRYPLFGLLVVGLMLTACSSVPTMPDAKFSAKARTQLVLPEQWSFAGRLAITGAKDAWQASISWAHRPDDEQIQLAGPLGQGATRIALSKGQVVIDSGAGRRQSSTQVEAFINQQLGMFVPVRSLRFWVTGMPAPSAAFLVTDAGFTQNGWLVEYPQMQSVGAQLMPRKMTVSNPQVKLKLIINEWDFNATNTH